MAITINGTTGITTTGITTTGDYDGEDDDKILLGTSDDLQIYHDGSHSFIKDAGTGTLRIEASEVGILSADGSETMAQFVQNGAVSLRYDNSTKLETDANGIHVTTNVHLPNNGVLELGDDTDMTITHSGSDFTMTNNTGGLTIGNNSGTGVGEGHITFKAGSNTECAKFTNSGFLKAKGNCASYHAETVGYHEILGDTSHDCTLKVRHNSSTGYGIQTLFNHNSSSIYALSVRDYSNGNYDKAFIRCDGDFESSNNSYGGISDVKLKENIVDAKSQWDDIKALKVRNFNFKIDENKTKLLGLVAQEAEAVCPSLVKSQPDLGADNEDLGTETKVLKYSIVYMKAVKALQEAITRIETLETKVAALEAA